MYQVSVKSMFCSDIFSWQMHNKHRRQWLTHSTQLVYTEAPMRALVQQGFNQLHSSVQLDEVHFTCGWVTGNDNFLFILYCWVNMLQMHSFMQWSDQVLNSCKNLRQDCRWFICFGASHCSCTWTQNKQLKEEHFNCFFNFAMRIS